MSTVEQENCKSMSAPVLAVGIVFLLAATTFTKEASRTPHLTTPVGVRLLENKNFDDSDEARAEILELYKDLRLTDVLDGMDLIGLQDIGLMDNDIRPLWRDVEDFSHRIVGFAITVRHVPTDVRAGQNSFATIAAAKNGNPNSTAEPPTHGSKSQSQMTSSSLTPAA